MTVYILVLSSLSFAAQAQSADEQYVPMVEQGKVWRYTAGFLQGTSPNDFKKWCKDYYSKIEGVETIDGVEYAVGWFYKDGDSNPIKGIPAFYLNEDVDKQQVTARFNPEFDFGFCDFSSVNGISIPMFCYNENYGPFVAYDFKNPDNSWLCNIYAFDRESCTLQLIEGVGLVATRDNLSYGHDVVMPYPNPTYISGFSNIGPMMFLYAVDSPSSGRIYYHQAFDYANFAGVETITAPTAAPAEYYNLQGIRIDTPAPGQLLIRRQGNTIDKIIL